MFHYCSLQSNHKATTLLLCKYCSLPILLVEDAEYTIPQMPGGHLTVFKSVSGRATRNIVREDNLVCLAKLKSYF